MKIISTIALIVLSGLITYSIYWTIKGVREDKKK